MKPEAIDVPVHGGFHLDIPDHVQRAIDALRAAPGQVLDLGALFLVRDYAIDPIRVALLLSSRGQYPGERESIRDAVARHYGADAARLLEAAL